MSKKVLKIIFIVVDLIASIAAIVYIIKMLKDDSDTQNASVEETDVAEEDSLHAKEAIDFSDLKFSRNYVDLR